MGRMRLFRRLRTVRLGLLSRFALVSFAALLLLGFVLASVLCRQIRARALASGEQSAQLLADVTVGPTLEGRDLQNRLDPERLPAPTPTIGGPAPVPRPRPPAPRPTKTGSRPAMTR